MYYAYNLGKSFFVQEWMWRLEAKLIGSMDRKKLNNQGTLYEIVLLNVSFQYSITNFGGKVLSWQKKLPRFTEIKFKL
jgi:hypothetical protein